MELIKVKNPISSDHNYLKIKKDDIIKLTEIINHCRHEKWRYREFHVYIKDKNDSREPYSFDLYLNFEKEVIDFYFTFYDKEDILIKRYSANSVKNVEKDTVKEDLVTLFKEKSAEFLNLYNLKFMIEDEIIE